MDNLFIPPYVRDAKPSPQALTPELIETYRTIMTPVGSSDWDGLKKRVDAASRLAKQAFLENDRAAWEVVQVIEWRLQGKSWLRPTEPGDVHVLDVMYRIEELNMPAVDLPKGLTPLEFCEMLTKDFARYSAADTGTIEKLMGPEGVATKKDWEYLGRQFLAISGNLTRLIALASLPLTHKVAMVLYANLYDEGGRGVWERTHYYLFNKIFLPQFGWDDKGEEPNHVEDSVLYWASPEYLASFNVQTRLLWHPEPGWGLGSLYLYEKVIPGELEKIRDGLLRAGCDRSSLVWFDEHIVVDVKHAEDWIGAVEEFLISYDDQRIAYQAAMERGRWGYLGVSSIYQNWQHWKKTGVPPHVPGRELRAATGV